MDFDDLVDHAAGEEGEDGRGEELELTGLDKAAL